MALDLGSPYGKNKAAKKERKRESELLAAVCSQPLYSRRLLEARVAALEEVLRFVAHDPCFKVLGSVTQDEVRDAISNLAAQSK